MKKYKTASLFLLLAAFLLAIGFSQLVSAEESAPRVFDRAGLFSPEETEELEKESREFFARYGQEMLVVTTRDAEGKSSRDYAADFYDTHFGNTATRFVDGVIVLLDMDNREINLVTTGRMIEDIDRDAEESVYDAGIDGMKSGDYGQAAKKMVRRVAAIMNRLYPGPNGITAEEAGASGVAGLGTAAGFYAAQRKKYKGQKKPLRYQLGANRLMNLVPYSDELIDSRITAVPLPRNNSQKFGGGSSGGRTFTGSSGTSHGGGGGRGF